MYMQVYLKHLFLDGTIGVPGRIEQSVLSMSSSGLKGVVSSCMQALSYRRTGGLPGGKAEGGSRSR